MAESVGLENVYLFRGLSPERLAQVKGMLVERCLPARAVLFEQGAAGDELYIVREGCVSIFSPSADQPGQEKPIRLFRAGDALGEMALIDRQPRSLSARAEEPSRLLVLHGDDFRDLARCDPDMAFAVMRGLNDRLRYTTEFLSQVRRWVGRISTGKYQATEFQAEMHDWVRQVADGVQDTAAGSQMGYQDETLATLAAEFAQMATEVRDREEALQREVAQLRIEIDVSKRQRQVEEIVDTEYFQSLAAQAASLRRKRE